MEVSENRGTTRYHWGEIKQVISCKTKNSYWIVQKSCIHQNRSNCIKRIPIEGFPPSTANTFWFHPSCHWVKLYVNHSLPGHFSEGFCNSLNTNSIHCNLRTLPYETSRFQCGILHKFLAFNMCYHFLAWLKLPELSWLSQLKLWFPAEFSQQRPRSQDTGPMRCSKTSAWRHARPAAQASRAAAWQMSPRETAGASA